MCACLAVLLPAAAALVLSHPNPDPTQSVLKVSGSSYNIFGVSSSTYNKWGSFVLWECSPTCDLFRTGYDAARTMAGASCCTQSFQTSYYNCVSCAGVVIDGTDYTKAQADMDDFYVSCYDRGYPLQKLTLPGQDPSRTPSTYSRVGTSSIHGTLPSGWLTMSEWSPPSEPTTTSMSSLPSITAGDVYLCPSYVTSSTSTPTTLSTASGLSAGGSGAWSLVSGVIGLGLIVF